QVSLRKWPRTDRNFTGRNVLWGAHLYRKCTEFARKNDRRARTRADTNLHRLYLEVCASNPRSRICAAVDLILLLGALSFIFARINVFLTTLRSSLTNTLAKIRSPLGRSYERIHHHRYCSDSGCERAVLSVL